MISTSWRLTLTTGVAVLALAGCGSSPLRAAAAATVGKAQISTDQLAQTVTAGLADPQAQQALGSDRPKFQRDALSRLISHLVLAEAASRKKVTVTEGEVDTQLAAFGVQAGGKDAAEQMANLEKAAAQGGVPKAELRPYTRDLVLRDALGDALTADLVVTPEALKALYAKGAATNDQVHTRHILVADEALAKTVLAQLQANPEKFAALAMQYSTDSSNKAKGGDLGFAGTGAFVPAFEKAAFAAKPGVPYIVKTQFGFHVVELIERRTTTLAAATPALRRQALAEQRTTRTAEYLRAVALSLGIDVNPRFGRWDAATGGVVDIPVDASSVSSPQPGTSGQPGSSPQASPQPGTDGASPPAP